MDTLTGFVERKIFENPDTGYGVVGVITDDGWKTAVGPLCEVEEDTDAVFTGKWVEHPRYGLQFNAVSWEEKLPAKKSGIIAFLCSDRIKGVGKKLAERIYKRFGNKTLDILENDPERWLEVDGITEDKLEVILENWDGTKKPLRELSAFLAPLGASANMITRVYEAFHDRIADIPTAVKKNPYCLTDVDGIGFQRADRIADSLGIRFDSPFRLEAGVKYLMKAASMQGHTYVPRESLERNCWKVLRADASEIIDDMIADEKLIRTDEGIYTRSSYRQEKDIARYLLKKRDTHPASEQDIREAEERLNEKAAENIRFEFDESQKQALMTACSSGVSVITGGPGTGKTTILAGLVALYDDFRVVLAAPTGKAAKRMEEKIGRKAQTIHRLLKYDGYGFNEDEITGDLLIVDEMSMTDSWLMANLLRRTENMQIVLIGDADQLPSVGAGNVLRDIIDSGCVPVTRLNHIHRQGKDSPIIEAAHAINEGRMPDLDSGGAFSFIPCSSAAEAAETAVNLKLENEDMQILTPIHGSAYGTDALNPRLSAALNPNGREIRSGDYPVHVGDTVMETRNDYEHGIFNGDTGTVVRSSRGRTAICFDGWKDIELTGLDGIIQAYAITIHKSQGSEYDEAAIIVMPGRMNYRALLYTAVTRCQNRCIIIGTKEAVAACISSNQPVHRYTGLREKIKREAEKKKVYNSSR